MATVTSFPITTTVLSPLIGIKLDYSTTTADADPGAGTFRLNNATVASATAAYISETDKASRDITAILTRCDDSTSTIKGVLRFENPNDQTIWAEFEVTGSVVDGADYRKLTLQNGVSAGTFADGDEFAIQFLSSGDAGTDGVNQGVLFVYDTTTTDSDPGSGKFRFNNATVSSVTAGYFDNNEAGGSAISGWLDTFDDSTNTAKGTLSARGVTTPTAWAVFNVTGSVVDGTGYRKLTLAYVAHGGTWTNGDTFAFLFSRSGDKGADGGGLSAVVDDTTPQLGGQLDVNGNAIGDGTLELLKFEETASAVNEVTIVNAATGNGPTIKPTGDDTDIDLLLIGKGTGKVKVDGNYPVGQGKHTIGVSSGAIFPATTNGCASLAQGETSSNKINYKYLAFDASAVEYAWVWFPTPKSYNASTFTMRFVWSHPSTTTNFDVVWQAEMLALANDDALDTAVGTAVTVTDTGGTTGDFYTTAETGAITPSNTAAKQDWIACRVSRLATNGSDTMAVDAHLIGIEIYYTSNAATDA